MITKQQYENAKEQTLRNFAAAGIAVTDDERATIEVADFGLSDLKKVGLQLLTYINTSRVCAKEMYLMAGQVCPQHRHVGDGKSDGKEETFRCRRGQVYLYVEGSGDPIVDLPATDVSVFHEVVLNAGEQFTIDPNTWHWFKGGEQGAVISEFSTASSDETDLFYDKRIVRAPKVED